MFNNEKILVWKDYHIKEVELSKARLLNYAFPKHFHESYEFGFSCSGAGIINCAGEKNIIGPNQLAFFHPGEVNSEAPKTTEPWIYYSICIEESIIQEIVGHSNTITFGDTIFSNFKFKEKFLEIFNLFSRSHSKLEKEVALYNFIRSIIKSNQISSLDIKIIDNAQFNKICNYIDENFKNNFSINDISMEFGLHPNYIFELFNKFTGISPHRYQNQLRINAAKNHLITQKPLSEIALDLGFYDQSHFTKIFKQTTGVSPGFYQNLSNKELKNFLIDL